MFIFHSINTYGDWGSNLWERLFWKRNLEHVDWSWLTDPKSEEYKKIETITLYHKLAILANLQIINKIMNRSKKLIEEISKELE
jgi:hypothetical protein